MVQTRAHSAAQKGGSSSVSKNPGKQPQGIQKRKNSPQHSAIQPTRREQSPSALGEHISSKNAVKPEPIDRGTKTPVDADDSDSSAAVSVNKPIEVEMERVLARKKTLSSPNRKRSDSATSTTPSDQIPREEKSIPYRDQRYDILLATKGSIMDTDNPDIATIDLALCKNLLEANQVIPEGTLFRDDIFRSTCQKLIARNEARIIQDISRLIVPSAESLATLGAKHLEILVESVNQGWSNAIPFIGPRPQPDYSVGFDREAFGAERLAKLSPCIGDFLAGDESFFMGTWYMYFPFLSCEVKRGAGGLDVADRQNAHSMTLAVRGVVELFRVVERESEVDRKILAFSISHDHRSVRIYGHFPVIDGQDTKYYRHPIHVFDFKVMDGKEKWTAYRFVKNVH